MGEAAVAEQRPMFKPKKSVALSGTPAGNTALCTVGRSGNDLHYRGYDILDLASTSEFEEIAHLLIHGTLPNESELIAYKTKLKSLRGVADSGKGGPGMPSRCSPSNGCYAHRSFDSWLRTARKR